MTSPRATFEASWRHRAPAGVLFIVAMVIGLAVMIPQLLNEESVPGAGRRRVEFTERITGKSMTPEELPEDGDRRRTGLYFTPVNMLIVLPIVSLAVTAVYWVVFNADPRRPGVVQAGAGDRHALAGAHRPRARSLAAPIQYAQGKMTAPARSRSARCVPMLAPDSLSRRILGVTSVFTLWGMVVAAIGLAVLYRRKTRNIAIGLIVVYFLIVATVM